jgi:hypothetical protein
MVYIIIIDNNSYAGILRAWRVLRGMRPEEIYIIRSANIPSIPSHGVYRTSLDTICEQMANKGLSPSQMLRKDLLCASLCSLFVSLPGMSVDNTLYTSELFTGTYVLAMFARTCVRLLPVMIM